MTTQLYTNDNRLFERPITYRKYVLHDLALHAEINTPIRVYPEVTLNLPCSSFTYHFRKPRAGIVGILAPDSYVSLEDRVWREDYQKTAQAVGIPSLPLLYAVLERFYDVLDDRPRKDILGGKGLLTNTIIDVQKGEIYHGYGKDQIVVKCDMPETEGISSDDNPKLLQSLLLNQPNCFGFGLDKVYRVLDSVGSLSLRLGHKGNYTTEDKEEREKYPLRVVRLHGFRSASDLYPREYYASCTGIILSPYYSSYEFENERYKKELEGEIVSLVAK